jgi:RimJ/RimL family protein N-acetyltransferase
MNPGAIRCYEKVGFKIEGRKREDHYLDDKYHDIIVMGILRHDFIDDIES